MHIYAKNRNSAKSLNLALIKRRNKNIPERKYKSYYTESEGKRQVMSKEKDLRKLISLIPFWQDTPEDFIDYCVTHGRVRRYAAKQYVYFSYDDSVSVFFLLKGRIQILLTSEFSEKIFRVIKPPAFFPEVVFDGKPAS